MQVMTGHEIGHARMRDAIRDGEQLHEVLQTLLAGRTQFDREVAAGAVFLLLDAYTAARKAGYRATVADPETNAAMQRSHGTLLHTLLRDLCDKSRRRRAVLLLSGLCGMVQAVAKHVRFRSAEDTTKPAAPLRVEIVSLPATMAVQTVERDESDDIKRTVTITTSSQQQPQA